MTKMVIFVGYVRKAHLDYFLEKGYTVGLLRDKNNEDIGELEISQIDDYLDFVFPIDFTNQKVIENSLKSVYFKENTLLICLYDRYLLGTAYIANFLKLKQAKNLPVELARNATNKLLQRKTFIDNYPEISPQYKKIKNFHGAYIFTRKYGFPVIIKPANLSQSQLVNVCENLEELIAKGSYVFDNVAKVYEENHVYRTPQVGIEQYITGKQFSVDSYVDFEGNIFHTPVCEQILGFDVGKDNFETVYSMYSDNISKETQDKIYDAVEKSIKSMKIKGNPTHIEVRLTPKGECKIVEVNLRTGGYRSDMLWQSYGINHIENFLNLYLGYPVEVPTKLLKHSSCPQFWPEEEGTFVSIEGSEEVKKLPSFVSGLGISPSLAGSIVGPSELGHQRITYVIMAHENKEQLMKDIETARKIIKIKVKNLPSTISDDQSI
jgi:biotin carboxylase